LSLKITNKLPTYPGDPVDSIFAKTKFEESGYNILSLNLGTHSGTHVDVPLHLLKNGKSIDDVPLDRFFGEAFIVEILKDKKEIIRMDEIKKFDIRKNDIFIIRTGWEKYKYKKNYFTDFPYFDLEVADYILSKKIKALGVDMPSVDGLETHGAFHKKLMENGVVIIEALINLKKLFGRRMQFIALPLNIGKADGSPVRAVAFDEKIF
jgi:kynurenine formamidase